MKIVNKFKQIWPLAHGNVACKAIILVASIATGVLAQAQSIVVASTTSTEQSGLFGYLLPEFKKASGIDVKVVARWHRPGH
jgi:tungstate transport system substrate-binding protein